MPPTPPFLAVRCTRRLAYYLLHSMDDEGDFVARDRALATGFADAAREAGTGRIVYLSGLHPDGDLSPHLASRVEVGDDPCWRPASRSTVLQAAAWCWGRDRRCSSMLRHLTERLPVMVGPRWLTNRIQPIALADVVHYLVGAADLPPEVNRTIDIGMDEVLTYADMMRRYARVTGLRPRLVATVPVLTPWLALPGRPDLTRCRAAIAKPSVEP